MRRIFFILSICMALAACDDVPVAGEGMVQGTHVLALDADLVRYDSIMQSRPDSALVLLLSYPAQKEDETLSDSLSVKNDGINAFAAMLNRNYFYLLVSEALFKTDNMQTVRPQVQQAECFFDSLAMQHPDNDDITFLSARSHYMNGVGFYENDSVVEACKEYLNALEIMEAHFNEDELVGQKAKFMALSYGRLGDMFSEQFMMKLSVKCYNNALYFCEIAQTSRYGISNIYYRIGKQYDKMRELDTATYYYNLALEKLPDKNNLLYRDIISTISFLDYQRGLGHERTLDSLKHMLSITDNKYEKSTRYLTIGYIYYNEKKYDSAIRYLDAVFENYPLPSKIKAAEFLYNIYDSLGNRQKSGQYVPFIANNGQTVYDSQAQVSEISTMFMDYLQRKKDEKHNKSNHAEKQQIVAIVIPIIVIVTFVVVFASRKWRKRIIERHKVVSDNKLAEVRSALQESENAIFNLKMKIGVRQLIDEPICQHILYIVEKYQFKSKVDHRIYKDYALSKERIVELREAVNLHYNNFTIHLKEMFPELTNDDISYCCLYLLGLKDADVSALMQRSFSTVCNRRRKITSTLKSEINLTETLYNIASI